MGSDGLGVDVDPDHRGSERYVARCPIWTLARFNNNWGLTEPDLVLEWEMDDGLLHVPG